MNETAEDLADLATDILEEGIDVSIARKDAFMLFGAVIAANVATVFILSGITILAKSVATKAQKKIEKNSDDLDS